MFACSTPTIDEGRDDQSTLSKQMSELSIDVRANTAPLETKYLSEDVVKQIRSFQSSQDWSTRIEELQRSVDTFTAHLQARNRAAQVLQSLAFPEMHDRQAQIATAHEDTFEWIFTDETEDRSEAEDEDEAEEEGKAKVEAEAEDEEEADDEDQDGAEDEDGPGIQDEAENVDDGEDGIEDRIEDEDATEHEDKAEHADEAECEDETVDEDMPEDRLYPTLFDWLSSDRGLYWIRGKPGSGKSTLMKHIARSQKIECALKSWAGRSKLVIAHYYFWHAGSPMQRSQAGLLRSLLYEVYQQCQELIPEHDARSRQGSWDKRDLLLALREVVQRQIPIKFAFFVDGLDEYVSDPSVITKDDAEDTDHSEVADLLVQLSSNVDVKLCVSSREWEVFRTAFGRVGSDQLSLQEFTRDDMRKFTAASLEDHTAFPLIFDDDYEAYWRLIDSIVRRAEGVFLWVALVIKSVRRGMSNGDPLRVLLDRVRDFPPSLEGYYARILDSIEPRYRRQSALMIRIALTEPRLTIRHYSFIDDWHVSGYGIVEREYDQSRHLPSFRNLLKSTKRQLNVCCQDLLRVETCDCTARELCIGHKVVFTHRTVSEFVSHSTIVASRMGAASPDTEHYVLAALVAGIQILTFATPDDGWRGHVRLKAMEADVRLASQYTSRLDNGWLGSHGVPFSVLDTLYRTYLQHTEKLESGEPDPVESQTLLVAAKYDARSYIRHSVARDPTLLKDCQQYIGELIQIYIQHQKNGVDFGMDFVLGLGYNPNEIYTCQMIITIFR